MTRNGRSSERPVVRIWHDFQCPWSYAFRVRLEKVRAEFENRLHFRFLSFPLEILNKTSTPKAALEAEWPLCAIQEPAARFRAWSQEEWKWPVTMLPALEAAKCAEAQGEEMAARFDLAVREAFFWYGRTISMRHVLMELAGEVGLDMERFQHAFDSGTHRSQVIEEYEEGWRVLHVTGTPTMVLPDGRRFSSFTLTLPRFTADHRIARVSTPTHNPEQAVEAIRELLSSVRKGSGREGLFLPKEIPRSGGVSLRHHG